MSDLISREEAIDAIRKSASKFTGFMEMYTDDDAIKAVNTVPSAEPNEAELDKLRDRLNNRLDYISKLEAECNDLKEKLHEVELAVEHNRHVADEEQRKSDLRYRDGMIAGLKYAMRCNGVSCGEVNQ